MNLLRNLMNETNKLETAVGKITTAVNTVVGAVFGFLSLAAIIVSIMLAYKFFTATDEGKRKNAKMQLIYAIIAVIALVILSIVIPQVITALRGAAEVTAFQLMF